jgi:hypothetical protein
MSSWDAVAANHGTPHPLPAGFRERKPPAQVNVEEDDAGGAAGVAEDGSAGAAGLFEGANHAGAPGAATDPLVPATRSSRRRQAQLALHPSPLAPPEAEPAPHEVIARLAASWLDLTRQHPLAYLVELGPHLPAARLVELFGQLLSSKDMANLRTYCLAAAPATCLLVSPTAGGADGASSRGYFETPEGRVCYFFISFFCSL